MSHHPSNLSLLKRGCSRTCLAVFALLFILNPVHASASEDGRPYSESASESANMEQLEEMVVTATRSPEEIREIPAKVEVIDRQEIELTSGETITEQLKKNSSIGVIEYPGALAGIGIRGFRPEFSGITKHSLILINGRPAGATNLATITSDNIERIEVLKGPASSLYGGEAMGGVINVITRRNIGALAGRAEAGFGSFRTNFQKGGIGGRIWKNLDFDIAARRYEQAGDIEMGNGEERKHTGFITRDGSFRLGMDIGSDWRTDLTVDGYQGRDIETPGDTFDGDAKSGYKDIDRYGVDFRLGGQVTSDYRLDITAYHTGESSEYYKRYYGWSSPVEVSPYRSYDYDIDWTGVQVKNQYDWGTHRIVAGFDWQDIDRTSRSYNLDGSRKAPYSPDESRENWAGYVETIWRFMDERLTVTAGGRYDTFDVETKKTPYKTDFTPGSDDFSQFSPRGGVNYLFDNGLRVHTTLGQAFVPPAAAQLAGYSERVVGGVTMITKGNPDLDPETSLTFDFGLGYENPALALNFDMTYFHTEVDDKITRLKNGNVTTYENSLSARMDGMEWELQWDFGKYLDWNRSISLFTNATWMIRAEEENSKDNWEDIHNVATYTVNYGLMYDDGMFDARLHFRSQGTMKDYDWNAAGYPVIRYPCFTVADLVIGATFLDHHRLMLRVDNLFDKYYYEKKGFPKPGIAAYLSYRFEF